MTKTFLVSDTHFGHVNICKFTVDNGARKLRPWDHVDDMDREMIQRWNQTVGPKDKVYHLGDVVINKKKMQIMNSLNGDKVLIKGNHDIFKAADYLTFFRDIRAYHVLNGLILSHIPVHDESLGRFGTNVHGHLHANRVRDKWGKIDPRYFCVCVEHIDYRPMEFGEVMNQIKKQGGTVGFNPKVWKDDGAS